MTDPRLYTKGKVRRVECWDRLMQEVQEKLPRAVIYEFAMMMEEKAIAKLNREELFKMPANYYFHDCVLLYLWGLLNTLTARDMETFFGISKSTQSLIIDLMETIVSNMLMVAVLYLIISI